MPEPPAGPRGRRVIAVLAVVLIGLLGFAIAAQVRTNSGTGNLANLQDDDLVSILDNQNARADRLRQQIAELRATLRRLTSSDNRAAAARRQAQHDLAALGVLLGTRPAHGPGVVVTVSDPKGNLTPEQLFDVVEELRGAGAEAISWGAVRLSTDSAFTPAAPGPTGGRVSVDGRVVAAPYRITAIGGPKTLDTALNIPGGVASVLRTDGAALQVSERRTVVITATRPLPVPKYASPSPP